MRIVHAVPVLTKGGGERVAVDLANHAAAAGHEVTILSAFPGDPSLLPAPLDPRVRQRHVYPRAPSRFGRYAGLPPWVVRNRSWFATQDVLHCHMTFGAATGTCVQLVAALGQGDRPAVVETYHAVGMPIQPIHRWLHARMAERRDGVALMAEDRHWRRFLDKRPDLPSRVIHNGVAFEPPRGREDNAVLAYAERIGLPGKRGPVLGTVGRLAPERCPTLYVDMFAAVAAELGPDVQFILAGEGPERARVEARVRRHGVESQFHLAGVAAEPGLAMALLDLYIGLNVGPVTGVAALEAAAAGLPIVAVQLLEGRPPSPDDWIWSSSDLAAVAARAVELLRDPAERSALAGRQSDHVRAHHSVDVMAEAYYGLYDRALARNRRPARPS